MAAAVLAMQVVKELMEKMPAFFVANLLSISYCWFYTAYAQDSASKQSKWLKRIEVGAMLWLQHVLPQASPSLPGSYSHCPSSRGMSSDGVPEKPSLEKGILKRDID